MRKPTRPDYWDLEGYRFYTDSYLGACRALGRIEALKLTSRAGDVLVRRHTHFERVMFARLDATPPEPTPRQ